MCMEARQERSDPSRVSSELPIASLSTSGGVSCSLRRRVLTAGGVDVVRSVHSQAQVQLGPWEHPQDWDPRRVRDTVPVKEKLLFSVVAKRRSQNTALYLTLESY